jgi:hypothetical protein
MQMPHLNFDNPECVLAYYKNGEAAAIPIDAVCQLKLNSDGRTIVQPNSSETNAVVGVAHLAIPNEATKYYPVQVYGYRASSVLTITDTSIAAGVKLVPTAGADALVSSASGDLRFVLLESHTTGTGTVSKKIHITAM